MEVLTFLCYGRISTEIMRLLVDRQAQRKVDSSPLGALGSPDRSVLAPSSMARSP